MYLMLVNLNSKIQFILKIIKLKLFYNGIVIIYKNIKKAPIKLRNVLK